VFPPKDLVLKGKYVHLVPLDTEAHAQQLYECSHSGPREQVEAHWRYLFTGPYDSFESFKNDTVAGMRDENSMEHGSLTTNKKLKSKKTW